MNAYVPTNLPTSPSLANRRGLELHAAGRLSEAADVFREAAHRHPNVPEIHHNLAQTLDQCGDTEGAIRAYADALRADPRLTAAHAGLGMLLLRAARNEEARLHLSRALALDPSDRTTTSLHK